MHYLLFVTYFINVTHAYASGWPLFKTYWLKFRFGITGVKRFFFTKNAVTSSIRLTLPVPLAKGAVSSFFFLLSSSNNLLLFASSSTCFIRFRPNLVRMTIGWVATKVINSLTSKVMYGSQRSKKVILKENATPPTWFIGFWRNLVRITSRQVATKVINSSTLKVM